MNTHQLKYKGVILEITGTYEDGIDSNYTTPPDPQEFEIDTILLSDVDATELLEDNIDELQTEILNKFYR